MNTHPENWHAVRVGAGTPASVSGNPMTSYVEVHEKCLVCEDSPSPGTVPCAECEGTGRIACPAPCEDRSEDCPECDGLTYACMECDGTGKRTCPNCKGVPERLSLE